MLPGVRFCVFCHDDPKNLPKGSEVTSLPVPPQKNRERHAKDRQKSWRYHPRMTSGTFFQWEKNRSKGVQAIQTGGPPGFPMLPPRVESEGECFAPLNNRIPSYARKTYVEQPNNFKLIGPPSTDPPILLSERRSVNRSSLALRVM